MEPASTLCLALGLFLSAQGEAEELPPLAYSAQPMRNLVVDAETGEPLEGVVVVAQWVLFVSGPGHGGHGPRLHVAEAVTDSAGKVHIPGLGPKPNPHYPWSSLVDRDPMLSFFKPGYRPLTILNRWERKDAVRVSEWDGKTIKLQKFTGTPDEWARALRSLQISLGWVNVMDWRSLPRIVLALELERLTLARKRLTVPNISGLSALGTTIEEVREFLGRQQ